MMRSSAGCRVAASDCTDAWLQEAFAEASSREALAVSASEVRTLAGASLDRAFMLVTLMQRVRSFDNATVREVLRRMLSDGATGYSMMNAITSVARDTSDPETRWRLEAAGGGVPALLLGGPSPRDAFDALNLPTQVPNLDREPQLA